MQKYEPPIPMIVDPSGANTSPCACPMPTTTVATRANTT